MVQLESLVTTSGQQELCDCVQQLLRSVSWEFDHKFSSAWNGASPPIGICIKIEATMAAITNHGRNHEHHVGNHKHVGKPAIDNMLMPFVMPCTIKPS